MGSNGIVVKRKRKRRKEKKKKKTGREKKRENRKWRKRRKTVAGILLTFINNTSETKGNNMQFIARFCYNIRELFCF